jgi:AcrR family transcriptional regulator
MFHAMQITETENDIDPIIFELFEFRPTKGDLKKMEIIKASIECLAELGLEKTSYEAIAKKIGTRRAHVAYHFSDKHDIFRSAVKYILATYQQISIEHLQQSKSGEQMLVKYVEAVFEWAKSHPEQVSVMLLLYYLCTIKEDYLELHHQIRTKGQERIAYILLNKLKISPAPKKAMFISKSIQNLISAAILDSVTTKNKSLDDAKEDVLIVMKMMLSSKDLK